MLYQSKDGIAVGDLQCLSRYFELDKVIPALFRMNQSKSDELYRMLLAAQRLEEAAYIQFCTDEIIRSHRGLSVKPVKAAIDDAESSPFLQILAEAEAEALFPLVEYILLNFNRANPRFLQQNQAFLHSLCNLADGNAAAEYFIFSIVLLYLCIEYAEEIPPYDRERIRTLTKDLAQSPRGVVENEIETLTISSDTDLPWWKGEGTVFSNLLCRNIGETACVLRITDERHHVYDRTVLLPGGSVWALRFGPGFVYFQEPSGFDCSCNLGELGTIRVDQKGKAFFMSADRWNTQPPAGLALSRPVVSASSLGAICCLLHEDGSVSTNHPRLRDTRIENALRVCVLSATIAVIHRDHSVCFYPNDQNQMTAPEGKYLTISANTDTYVGITLDGRVKTNRLLPGRSTNAVTVSFRHGQFEIGYADGGMEFLPVR